MPSDHLLLPDEWVDAKASRTVEDYDNLDLLLYSVFEKKQRSLWEALMRWLCRNDLFFLVTRVSTCSRVVHGASGERLFNRPFILNRCREIEREEHMVMDLWGRGMGKSSLKTRMRNIQRVLNNPDSSGFIWSYDKLAASKHLRSISQELTINESLKRLFPDILYQDPKKESPLWSTKEGLIVKRKTSRPECTFEAHGLKLDGIPTGSHPDRHDLDDVEDKRRVRNKDSLTELKEAYSESANIKSSAGQFVRTVTGTPHSSVGLIAQLMDDENITVRYHPGEDLSKNGAGPMGGVAHEGFFSTAELWSWWAEFGSNRAIYCQQICLDITAGEARRFLTDRIHYFNTETEKAGRECNVYICQDPSPGRNGNDPTAIWVWGLSPDKRFRLLDASLKKMTPDERLQESLRLARKWEQIAIAVVQIRVEEFGQADYVHITRNHLEDNGCYIPVVKCSDQRTSKVARNFERWGGPLEQGKVSLPARLMAEGEEGKLFDVVDFFVRYVLEKFPKPVEDNLLDAGALLWEDPNRKIPGGEGAVYGDLLFPEPGQARRPDEDHEPQMSEFSYQSAGLF